VFNLQINVVLEHNMTFFCERVFYEVDCVMKRLNYEYVSVKIMKEMYIKFRYLHNNRFLYFAKIRYLNIFLSCVKFNAFFYPRSAMLHSKKDRIS
jgi:hypothetical protein